MPTLSRIMEDVPTSSSSTVYIQNLTNGSSPPTGHTLAGFQIVSLDEHFMDMIFWVLSSFSLIVISSFGIVSNTINIKVFLTIGFSNTANISLCGLSLSDLGALVTLLWIGICYVPLLERGVLPFLPREVAHITGCWPHVMFCRASGWITSFVAFERFLCIAFPLKVKRLITTREVKVIMFVIFFFTFISAVPMFYTHRLGLVFVPDLNSSLLGLTYPEHKEWLESFSIPLISVVPAAATFCLTIFFTVGLVIKLNQKTKWRLKAVKMSTNSDTKEDPSTSRDEKLARMMLAVCTIFIVCFVPFVLLCIVLFVVPEYGTWYGDVYLAACSFSFVFEGINSSVNIFVYYNMSSKYKEVFDRLWSRNTGSKDISS